MIGVFDERVEYAVQNLFIKPVIENGIKAKAMLEEAAGEGDGDACFFLARCYFGECFVDPRFGFEESDEKGAKWLEKGLSLGSAVAMFGGMRVGGFKPRRGNFIYPPYRSLKEIWNEVENKANAGEIFCKYMIANAYYFGDVIEFSEIDPNTVTRENVMGFMFIAIDMYEEIIASGSILGIPNLINILTSGDYGMPKDEKRARELRHIGAERGVGRFEYEVGMELEEAGNIDGAAELYEKAVSHNSAGACYRLGCYYSYNGKLPMNLTKAKELFLKGIELEADHTGCNNKLGEIYFYGGDGLMPDYVRAVRHFLTVRPDSKWCSDMLGTCYLQGLGTPVNYEAARKEFEVYPGECLSAIGLGEIYAYALGVEQDIERAMGYWNKFPEHPRVLQNKKNFKKTLFGWKIVRNQK